MDWEPFITSYWANELRALKFPSVKEYERATQYIFHDAEFAGMPVDTPDGITLIVPEEAVELFKAKGLKFKASEVLSPGDLSSEERIQMHRDLGV